MSAQELSRAQVMHRIKLGTLTQREAARLLRLSVRQIKRLWRAYRSDGARALISRKRGRPSNNRLDPLFVQQVVGLVKARYPDFGPTLAREKLGELHGLQLGLETLRQIMIAHGLWTSRKQRRLIVHALRQRRPCFGELIQIDGSPHAWLENRGPRCTLLVYVDDATGKLMHLRFVKAETTFAYFAATRAYVGRYGKPLAFYSDRLGIFRVNEPGPGAGKTQFARALAELDIELICANSPQAKGRVERANQTLQDRLIKELRLRDVATLEKANAFLPRFMREYNRRFARAPLSPHDAHRPLRPTDNLDRCFTLVNHRTVSKTLTVQYGNALYQVLKPLRRLRYSSVEIREDESGAIAIQHQGHSLPYTRLLTSPRQAVADRKLVNAAVTAPRRRTKPDANHPWRKPWRKVVLPDYLREISVWETEDIHARG